MYKDKYFTLVMTSSMFSVEEKKNNDPKDSFANYFGQLSIQTTEHEIMQILLSGRVGIDPTHLDGFLPCSCVNVCMHESKIKGRLKEGLLLCESICVCGH